MEVAHVRTHTEGPGFAPTRQVLLLFARLVGPIWGARMGPWAPTVVALERSLDVLGFWRTARRMSVLLGLFLVCLMGTLWAFALPADSITVMVPDTTLLWEP